MVRYLMCALTLVAGLLGSGAAFATDVGPQDGNTYGGGAYRLQCSPNAYLYGMSGMVGSWVDRVGGECADWDPAQGRWSDAWNARRSTGTVGTSTGGGAQSAICPPGTLVKGFAYTFAVPDRTYMQNITLQCVDPLAPYAVHSEQPELRSDNGNAPWWGNRSILDISAPFHAAGERWHALACPGNQVAIGIQGGSGTYVDWIGLICAPAPLGSIYTTPSHITGPASTQTSSGGHGSIFTHPGPGMGSAIVGSSNNSAPVAGSWSASCTDGSLYSNVLTAKCKSTTGLEVTSSIDITTCKQPPSVANINGKLVCENGVAGSGGGYGGGSSGGYGGGSGGYMGSIDGNWQTSEGPMTLNREGSNRIDGTYAQDSGRIKLHREGGNFWAGDWSEGSSDHRCHDEKLGSHYWGHVELTFSPDNRHFNGQWQYCGDPAFSKPWTGDHM